MIDVAGRLAGKVAFVTGAGGAIGGAICRRFLAAGARVVGTDISDAGMAASFEDVVAEGRALMLRCDVGEGAEVAAAVERTIDAFGRIDVLCNVAGGSTNADDSVIDAPEEEFWRAIRLDLFGTFLCCKHTLPHMIAGGGGSVINMASMTALMPVPRRTCYTAAKGGVVTLTRAMAAEHAPQKIRVNAIAPGITMTPRLEGFLETNVAMQRLAARHLLGTGKAEDVADMALFLASDESRIVTGQVIAVDGGVTIS